ncbi:hypothetical protein M9979_08705 [Sphingomonas sp. RP10(2022)]|uniref:Lipoprotein n=1 Tax=Sphingomonas liriopis TaxID=2949094 RepID=A0A9X2HVK6_9SPHN|nr:hypothetical protein [Sphingomonas liriopis]MCP3734946.1 hypothetical protein [Sphingomonas liriopis]
MRTLLLAPLLLLAACGSGGKSDTPDNAAAAGFVPPPTQLPTPIPGQEHSNPITAYVGKYPGDAVDGVGFYDRTEVSRALIDAVGDEKVRRRFTSRDAVSVPIWQAKDGRIAAHGCEPHNCSDVDWTFFVTADGARGEACFHDAATMGATSRWYAANVAPATRPGDCPQE